MVFLFSLSFLHIRRLPVYDSRGVEQKERYSLPYLIVSSYEFGEQRETQELGSGCFEDGSQNEGLENISKPI